MRGIKISIITVIYNAEATLERTITSVANQSYRGIEYIIVDGGSTDNTIEIIKRHEAQVRHWISEPDRGLYDAMNKGLQIATGDYVWFLNAGDTLKDNHIVQQISDVVQRNNLPDIIYGETDLVDNCGEFISVRRLKAPRQLTWRSFRMGMLVCHQSFIVRREMAPLYNMDYRFSADFDWCIRCMKAAETIINSNLRLVNYLYEGLTTANRKASLRERYYIMEHYYGKILVYLLHIWFATRFCWTKLTGSAV